MTQGQSEKTWVSKPIPPEIQVKQLCQEINVSVPTARLLIQRGITTFEQAKAFFRDGLPQLHDPFLMRDMEKAVQRIEEAVDAHQKILFYGDYDVDGTTSVSLMTGFFRQRYPHIEFYIPDRYQEGYGISYRGIDYAVEKGFTLIVALDCGTKALEKVAYAKEKGVDFIICDHHTPGEQLPPAVALLNPKQTDCPYPFKELSGCGIGFKLLQAWCLRQEIPQEEAYAFLDLVAISTACDIVPMVGENRILTRAGLKLVNDLPRPGVKAILDIAGFTKSLEVSNLVFGFGPRINAAGRIAHANQAVQLLTAESPEEAGNFAVNINDKNSLRQDYDSSITAEALEMIALSDQEERKSTVLFKPDWHKGVIGIVASRCIETYYRPTIILTESNGQATGSARSVAGFDVYTAIDACSDCLLQFGGHKYAAGLTLELGQVDRFRERFEEEVASRITPEQLIPKINIDLPITLDEITPNFYKLLRQMAPFGPGNMTPVFAIENLVLADGEPPRVMKEKHLKFVVKHPDGKKRMEVLAFGMAQQLLPILQTGQKIKLCANLQENHFRGNTTLQLMLRDLKLAV